MYYEKFDLHTVHVDVRQQHQGRMHARKIFHRCDMLEIK